VGTPHVQLILDRTPVPASLQTALNRVNARVSVRSMSKAAATGISPSADVCVILPNSDESPDILDQILAEASDRACATMVLPAEGTNAFDIQRRLNPNTSEGMTADELTGRIRALCEIRRPLQEMRDQLDLLRRRDEKLMASARERDEQLRLASQIQMDLLPEALVDAEPLCVSTLYLPADHISGDIYDVTRVDEDRFSFSIADATGHGVPAALLTILIKRSFRTKEIVNGSYRIIEPDELLSRLNEEMLCTSFSACQFITGLHGIFDRATHEFRWARGGSPYPILLRPGELPRQLRSEGGLIGAVKDQYFEVATQRLEPGDTLLLYTDGLEALLLGRESICSDGAILESSWLDQVAVDGPDAALASIREQAAGMADNEWPCDDISVVAIRMS
jgi:sigma-B regulation protein RsbU (phosphoserine phosphatase)